MKVNNSFAMTSLLLLGWTLTIAILISYNLETSGKHFLHIANQTARTVFNHIVLTRAWNAKHGGIYVHASDDARPNPYLKSKNRDIVLPTGKMLTKINPAYMTRLISEMAQKTSDFEFHITSLNPLRPGNSPNKWEQEALQAFERGEKERSSFFTDQDIPQYRFMAPLMVDKTCMPCHSQQGYKIGEVRGGIAVYMAGNSFLAAQNTETAKTWATYAAIWFIGLLGIGLHTLQRLNSEKKIKNQLLFQQSLLNCMPTPVYYKDSNGLYKDCNEAFEAFTGVKKKEMIGRTVHDIFPPEEAKKYQQKDDDLMTNGGHQVYELPVATRIKGRRQSLFSRAIFHDSTGKAAGIVGVITDITGQKRLEEKLKHTANEFETIFDNTSMAIVYLKGKRIIHRTNKQFTKLFGYAQDEIHERSVEAIHLSHELFVEFGEKYYPPLRDGVVVQAEYQLKAKSGKMIWGSLYGKAVNPPHVEDGVIWIFEDITERKELEKLKEDVERIMIHDLRSPLSGIIGAAKLLLMEDNITQEQRTLISDLEKSAYRLMSRINISLDLYRMEMGSYEYIPTEIDLVKTLQQVRHNLTELSQQRDVEIQAIVNEQPATKDSTFPVFADKPLMHTLLTNIVRNAVEAAPKGSTVSMNMVSDQEKTTFSINNPGVVPARIRDKFFEKYSTYGKTKGIGLGTYSAKLMAETMGGTIRMETDEQAGTTITVTIPAQQDIS